jgi:DNA polymerase (family 10)
MRVMTLEEATTIAEKVKQTLSPYCDKIEIAGSIRRRKPVVHDIDIVLIEKPWRLLLLSSLIASMGRIVLNGDRIKRLWYGDNPPGISIDIYFATPATWATLLLIRTGSKENNIRLATLAKRRRWQLKASGGGLFNDTGETIAGETEESIYEALGIPYQQPWERG